MDLAYIAKSLLAHRTKLHELKAVPVPERDWITRGSIDYHRDCIRILRRMRADERKTNGSENDSRPA